MRIMISSLTLLLGAVACSAQNPSFIKRMWDVNAAVVKDNPLWTASTIAHLGASMADGASTSYHLDYLHDGTELNRFIVRVNQGDNTVFGPRGFGIKLGVFAGISGIEVYYIHKYKYDSSGKERRWVPILCTAANFTMATAFALAVANNEDLIDLTGLMKPASRTPIAPQFRMAFRFGK